MYILLLYIHILRDTLTDRGIFLRRCHRTGAQQRLGVGAICAAHFKEAISHDDDADLLDSANDPGKATCGTTTTTIHHVVNARAALRCSALLCSPLSSFGASMTWTLGSQCTPELAAKQGEECHSALPTSSSSSSSSALSLSLSLSLSLARWDGRVSRALQL